MFDSSSMQNVIQVSLQTGTAAMEPAKVPLMRPLTPSTVGPSLRQMERQLAEAEVQLRNSSVEIAARFEALQSRGDEGGGFWSQDQNSRTASRAVRTDSEVNGDAFRTEGLQPSDSRTETQTNGSAVNHVGAGSGLTSRPSEDQKRPSTAQSGK